MPEPITLGAILGWSAITAIGGVIGNRADAKFCRSLDETLRLAEAHKPGTNHDIQQALHEACYHAIIHLANATPGEHALRLIEAFAHQRIAAGPNGATAQAELARGIHKLAEGDSPLAAILDQMQAELAAAVQPHQLSPEFVGKFRANWIPWTARNYEERTTRDGAVLAISLFKLGASTKRLVERAVELGEDNLQVSKETLALLKQQQGAAKLRQAAALVDVPNSGRGIYGREVEIAAMLAELRKTNGRAVIPVVAPPGFGKSALLDGLVRAVAPVVEAGERVIAEAGLRGVVWVDCRTNNFDGYLLEQCGRLAGEVERFQQLGSALDLLRELNALGTVWIVFDYFERLLDSATHRIQSALVRELMEERLRNSYACRFLLGTRQVPELGAMLAVAPIEAVERGLQAGLPIEAAVAQLKEIGAETALGRATDEGLRTVAERLWRIPQAMVSAVGWLLTMPQMDVRDLLGQQFAAEDREAGMLHLMRLHVEAQRPEDVMVLRLVAFFDFPVPEQALGSLGTEAERAASLGRLVRNLVLQFARDVFGHVRYQVSHALLGEAVRGMEAIVVSRSIETQLREQYRHAFDKREWLLALDFSGCEIQFRKRYAPSNELAMALMGNGIALDNLGLTKAAFDVYESASSILRQMISTGNEECRDGLAKVLTNKAAALSRLSQVPAALAANAEAIVSLWQLVEGGREELRGDLAMASLTQGSLLYRSGQFDNALLAYDVTIHFHSADLKRGESSELANALMGKGLALTGLERVEEALTVYQETITMLRLLISGGRPELNNDLARALMNKGVALGRLRRWEDELAADEEAVAIRRKLVEGGRREILNDLAMAVMNLGVAHGKLMRPGEALEAYREAIRIWRGLVEGGRRELRHNLALAFHNRAFVLLGLARRSEALSDAWEARDLWAALVAEGRQELRENLEDAERLVKRLE